MEIVKYSKFIFNIRLSVLNLFTVMLLTIHIYGDSDLSDHHTAVQNCSSHGGLQSYEELVLRNGYILLKNIQNRSINLENGDTAWISGHVEFSEFLSWYGCYNNTRFINGTVLPNNVNLTSCYHFCDQNQTEAATHLGLSNKHCYCITTEVIIDSGTAIVKPNECSEVNPYNINEYESVNENTVSVFRVHKKLTPITNDLQQCVFAQATMPISYGTSSCYSTEPGTNGFICTNAVTGKLNNSCEQFFEATNMSQAYCNRHEIIQWLKAKAYCSAYSGDLVSDIFPTMLDKMANGSKYWTGMFRSFKVIEYDSRENVRKACLAVRRVGNKLVLDPDNCLSQKKYFCSNWRQHLLTTTTIQNYFSDRPKQGSKNYDKIYTVVAVIGVIMLAIIACVLFRHVKNRKLQERQCELLSTAEGINESIESPVERNALNYGYAQPLKRNRSAQVNLKKPPRDTLRKAEGLLDKNCKIKSIAGEESKDCSKGLNANYDRVDLSTTKRQVLDLECTLSEEGHIYDHTLAKGGNTGGGDYDKMLFPH